MPIRHRCILPGIATPRTWYTSWSQDNIDLRESGSYCGGDASLSGEGLSAKGVCREMIGALIFWIIVGLIAGALAKLVMPGDDPGGIVVTILIGIVGAVIGGWLLRLLGLGMGGGTGQWIGSIIAGFIGAVILLVIYRLIASRRTV
jgi:uncharacterized membrane protein YeaQ/YmgE (transglycosylase-associated protein family)